MYIPFSISILLVDLETRICGKKDDVCAIRARKFMRNKLFEEDDDDLAALNVTEAPSCKCYPGCHEINYSTEISQSILMSTFEVPVEYQKSNELYFEKNIAIVHIFFIESSYMKYIKNKLFGFPELLSNIGGLLGLFMGFSLLSVIEIFYYFIIRMWWRVYKKQTTKNYNNRYTVQPFSKQLDTIYPFIE